MKVDFKNKKVIIGGAIAIVVMTAGIVTAILMLNNKNISTPDTENEVITDIPSTEEDTNTEDTVENSDKPFNEEEWAGDDADKAKAFNYYAEIKSNGTLKSPEETLEFIKEIVGNTEDNIKSFPKKDGNNITEIYKNLDSNITVLKIDFNENKIAHKFTVYSEDGATPVRILTTTHDGYIKSLCNLKDNLSIITREYKDGKIYTEIERFMVEGGVITNTRTEFNDEGTKCKQVLELVLTKETEFSSTMEHFESLLTDEEKTLLK